MVSMLASSVVDLGFKPKTIELVFLLLTTFSTILNGQFPVRFRKYNLDHSTVLQQ
jgi:hypothetical protein